MTQAVRSSDKVRPLEAWRALRALVRNKEDTGQVFKVIDALAGTTRRRSFQRLCDSPAGRNLLAARPNLLAALMDRTGLAALPAESLGRRYHDFTYGENLTADGLVAASQETGPRGAWTQEEAWFGARMRDQHDLWHVVTGYGREAAGELALLAFTHAQTGNRGIAAIVAMGVYKARREAPDLPILKIVAEARARARACAWLPEQAWEELLALPLQEVRQRLRITPAHDYEAARPARMAQEARIRGYSVS